MEMSLTRLVENYYNAYETKDRKVVEDLLSEDFIFTSPEDDHIDTKEFFEKCWGRSDDHPVFKLEKIQEKDHEILIMYECKTADGRSFKNVEVFIFEKDKIKSIEVFFGRKSW
jgi:ketosteroid isomerase-like protein